MTRTILITGATDGIGFEAAAMLREQGATVLLHGRSARKLADARAALERRPGAGAVETVEGDLSRRDGVDATADAVRARHRSLDALVNNAGVFRVADAVTPGGLDLRFVVNTIAPALLTEQLLPLLGAGSRIVNLSSAAQATVDTDALLGTRRLEAGAAYAQSKLALTMWSMRLARRLGPDGPVVVAVNPGSLLATKMVREGFGVDGKDIGIGAGIITRAAIGDDFANATGKYFDNDAGAFAAPHPDALDDAAVDAVMAALERATAAF